MLVECGDARAEITIVVLEHLTAPLLPDLGFVVPQAPPPLERRAAIVKAAAVHFDDLPIRVYRLNDFLDARIEPAGENHVRHPVDIFEILLVPRHAVSHDVLEAEPRARRSPLVNGPEVLAKVVDR